MTRISSQDDLGAEKNIIQNVDEIEVEQKDPYRRGVYHGGDKGL